MSLKNAIGAVLLIAGTTIGAGVLALPVDTAHLGFSVSLVYFVIAWLFMTLGALYLLEANLQIGYGSNLITMARKHLGRTGSALTWIMYLLLLYSLTAAYLTGAGAWIQAATQTSFTLSIPQGGFLCALIVSVLLILGIHSIDIINRLLMLILFGAFFTLVVVALPQTQVHLLMTHHSVIDFVPVPLIVTTFGFAIIIPTLANYLQGQGNQLKNVILVGSLIPIGLYLIWQFVILGLIPLEGESSLLSMQQAGQPATDLPLALAKIAHTPWLSAAAKVFSIFALITSVLGVTLALFDFLADGLRIQKTNTNKIALALLTFVPPLFFVFYYPNGYAQALRFAGLYVSFILGVLPVLLVWVGRYRLKQKASYTVPGGKPLLLLTFCFFVLVMLIESAHLCGYSLRF